MLFVPVCCHVRDFGQRGFYGGPVAYCQVEEVVECPIFVKIGGQDEDCA